MMRSIVGTIALMVMTGTIAAQEPLKVTPENHLFQVTPTKQLMEVPIAVPAEAERVFIDPTTLGIDTHPTPTKESAIEVRVEICIDQGNSEANCRCRAETSARILEDSDFNEETGHLETESQTGLRDFQNRMLAEQPDRMFELGEALGQCPAAMMKLE
ncbi:MAG: hypothetical protein AAFR51_07555 [Pseudomonadota bacterium]